MFAKISLIEKYFFLISLIFIIIIHLIQDYLVSSKILVLYSILIALRLILFYQKVLPVVILLIFISAYIGPFYSHFFQGFEVAMWKSFNNSYYLSTAILILSIFLCSIFIFTKKSKDYVPIIKRLNIEPSTSIFFVSILIAFVLVHFGLDGENLLSGLNYGVIEYNRSPLFEYSIAFFLISFIYSNKNRTQKSILFFFILFLILKDFIYGGRVASLMLCILVYLLYFEYRISHFKMFIVIFISVSFLSLFSFIRTYPLLFLENTITFEILFDYYFSTNETVALMSNEGDLAHSSARLLGMVENNIITTTIRLKSIFFNILSILTPGIQISEFSNLAAFKKDIYPGGGGILFPVSFYIWLSYPGVVLAGFIVSRMIYFFIETNNNKIIIYLLLIFSTFPRWFAYSSIVAFKLCFYGMLLFILFNSFKKNKVL